SLYLLDELGGKRKQFPAASRDELIKEVIGMKARFQTYKDYAEADINTVLNEEEQTDAMILQATNFKSILFKNRGKGKFEISPLPMQAQISALYGMVAEDVNGDGNVDLVINGNDYGTEVTIGRYDALNGLVLLGDGKGNLKPQSIYNSGFYIPGNGKALVKLKSASNQPLIAASQNRGPLKLYAWRNPVQLVNFLPGEVYATLIYTDGHKRKVEYFKGDSFLSQSSSYIITSPNLASIIFTDYNKKERTITLSNQ
ncbi:MAG: FG-GAP repeat domain-containing protein, partial [Ferruginibacter sp.]